MRCAATILKPAAPLLDQLRDQRRRMLEIRVHHDDGLAARVAQPGAQRRLVAEIARERRRSGPSGRRPRRRAECASVPSFEPSSTQTISVRPSGAMTRFSSAMIGAILPASLWAGSTIENSGDAMAPSRQAWTIPPPRSTAQGAGSTASSAKSCDLRRAWPQGSRQPHGTTGATSAVLDRLVAYARRRPAAVLAGCWASIWSSGRCCRCWLSAEPAARPGRGPRARPGMAARLLEASAAAVVGRRPRLSHHRARRRRLCARAARGRRSASTRCGCWRATSSASSRRLIAVVALEAHPLLQFLGREIRPRPDAAAVLGVHRTVLLARHRARPHPRLDARRRLPGRRVLVEIRRVRAGRDARPRSCCSIRWRGGPGARPAPT